MTVTLENPVVMGETVVAALVRTSISQRQSERHVAVTGDRTPIALLVSRGERITALTPQGDPLTRMHIEDLCPGAIAKMSSLIVA